MQMLEREATSFLGLVLLLQVSLGEVTAWETTSTTLCGDGIFRWFFLPHLDQKANFPSLSSPHGVTKSDFNLGGLWAPRIFTSGRSPRDGPVWDRGGVRQSLGVTQPSLPSRCSAVRGCSLAPCGTPIMTKEGRFDMVQSQLLTAWKVPASLLQSSAWPPHCPRHPYWVLITEITYSASLNPSLFVASTHWWVVNMNHINEYLGM